MPAYACVEKASLRYLRLPVHRVSIPCTPCQPPQGQPCIGTRVCQQRMDRTLELMRRGELPEAPQRGPEVAKQCRDCGAPGLSTARSASAAGRSPQAPATASPPSRWRRGRESRT
jgi:hypothetical protein